MRDIHSRGATAGESMAKAGREFSLQFYALALVSPSPEVRETLDVGVRGYHPIVMLLERALPHLSHEDICWRLYLTLKLSHQNERDATRLDILSQRSVQRIRS